MVGSQKLVSRMSGFGTKQTLSRLTSKVGDGLIPAVRYLLAKYRDAVERTRAYLPMERSRM